MLVAARFALEGCGSAGYDLAGLVGSVQVDCGGSRRCVVWQVWWVGFRWVVAG